MTGRELIIHILSNNLEDEVIFQNDTLIGFMNISQAAVKFGVGTETIKLWVKFGRLKHVQIGSYVFIPITETNPMERTA